MNPKALEFDLEELPMDVFDLADSGLKIDSLTAGHGMVENGASSSPSFLCSCCSGCAA